MLGGFYTMISFAGSIGAFLHGSVLEPALEWNYGKVTVSHVLSSKAIAKTLRAHFLVKASLMTLLLKPFLPHNTNPSQIQTSKMDSIGENDQLPSDDQDKIVEETGDKMIRNPEYPVTWSRIIFEKHQDL